MEEISTDLWNEKDTSQCATSLPCHKLEFKYFILIIHATESSDQI